MVIVTLLLLMQMVFWIFEFVLIDLVNTFFVVDCFNLRPSSFILRGSNKDNAIFAFRILVRLIKVEHVLCIQRKHYSFRILSLNLIHLIVKQFDFQTFFLLTFLWYFLIILILTFNNLRLSGINQTVISIWKLIQIRFLYKISRLLIISSCIMHSNISIELHISEGLRRLGTGNAKVDLWDWPVVGSYLFKRERRFHYGSTPVHFKVLFSCDFQNGLLVYLSLFIIHF